MVQQKQLTKGKAALVLILAAAGAMASRTQLEGWHVYLGLAIVGAGLFIGFIRWNRKF